jgi:hypothetical protein
MAKMQNAKADSHDVGFFILGETFSKITIAIEVIIPKNKWLF